MSKAILLAAYYPVRDQRTRPARCSRCRKRPVVIVGARSGRRYLCIDHGTAWATIRGYDTVDLL